MATCWYVCGPTVYDAAHLGHARTYVTVDIARRLARRRRPVLLAMNITDVDDKIIARAAERGVEPTALAREHEASFWKSMAALGVEPPDVAGRVTEAIPAMRAATAAMLAAGRAYQTADGSVYYRSGGGDAGGGDAAKRCAEDFAVWKATEGPGTFPSPWGRGRPGWHLECAVLIPALLGAQPLDLHWGGIDLKFPHHCNERLIRTALDGAAPPWRFEHVGHLHIEGRKMGKSLKNFITIDDALGRFTADELRLTFARHKHGEPMRWSEDAVVASRGLLRRYEALRGDVARRRSGPPRTAPLTADDAAAADEVAASERQWAACVDIRGLPEMLDRLAALPAATRGTAAEPAASRLVDAVLAAIGIDVAAGGADGGKMLDVVRRIRVDLRAAKQYALSDRIRDVYLPAVGVHDGDADRAAPAPA